MSLSLVVGTGTDPVVVERWSERDGPLVDEIESVRRELRRAAGEPIFEPPE